MVPYKVDIFEVDSISKITSATGLGFNIGTNKKMNKSFFLDTTDMTTQIVHTWSLDDQKSKMAAKAGIPFLT